MGPVQTEMLANNASMVVEPVRPVIIEAHGEACIKEKLKSKSVMVLQMGCVSPRARSKTHLSVGGWHDSKKMSHQMSFGVRNV